MGLNRLAYVLGLIFLASCTQKSFQDTHEPGEIEGEPSGAWLSMQAWNNVRFGDENPVDASKIVAEFNKTKASLRSSDRANWKPLGPMNIGGRTLCLAFHPTDPNIIYLGAASGGLWKTNSAGEGYHGWIRVPINLPVYSIASILISPRDPNVIIAGTGEVYSRSSTGPGIVDRFTRGTYGMGIIKSTDGGKTWNQSLALGQNIISGVQDMEFDPFDDQIIYAATTQGIYKSTNQGLTWKLINDTPMAVDIDINPNNPEIIYATFGSFHDNAISGIYRSNNSGLKWTKLTSGLPSTYSGKAKLAISKSNPSILYASIADFDHSIGLFATSDGGDHWTLENAKDAANVQGWYSHDIAIDPKNPDFISYVGQNAYISDTRGITFTNVSSWDAGDNGRVPVGGSEGIDIYVHADIHATYFHPLRPTEIYFATDGGVFVSKDRGNSFVGRNGGLMTTQFYANFSASLTNKNFAFGGMQDNGSAIYDGSDAWIKVIGGDGMSAAISPLSDKVLFGTYQYFGLNRSMDGGQTFESIRPNSNVFQNEEKAFNTPFEISSTLPNVLFAGGQRIYINEQNGNPNNWQPLHTDPLDPDATILAMAISPFDPSIMLASTSPLLNKDGTAKITSPKIFRTANGGSRWVQLSNLPNKAVMDISFDPAHSNLVYAVLSGFGKGHVFKSVNSGLDWLNIDNGLPDVPTNCIAINPKNTDQIYIGTDLGVYASYNGGNTWEHFMNGLPTAVMAMSISITDNVMKVATHGNGVYESEIPVDVSSKDISNENIKSFMINPNPASDHIRIQIQSNLSSTARISIYDLHGRVVLTKSGLPFTNGFSSNQIDVSSLIPGHYTTITEGVLPGNNGKFVFIRKLVKA